MALLRKWAPALLKAAIVAAIVVFVARNLPLKAADIVTFLAEANERFYVSLMLFAVFLMLQAGIWVLMVNAASTGSGIGITPGAGRIGLLTGLRIFIGTQFGKYIPGGVWNYAGRIMYVTRAGVPLGAQFSAIVYENVLLGAAAMAYALVLAFCLNVHPLPLILGAGTVVLLGYLYYPRITGWIHRSFVRAFRFRLFRKPLERITKLYGGLTEDGSKYLLSRNQFVGYLAGYIASHLVMGAAFWLLVNSFDEGKVSYAYAVGTFATSWLIGLLSPLPGGLGIREGFLVYFLSMKVDQATALQISVIARLWNIMAEVLFWMLIQAVSQAAGRVRSYES